MLDLFGKGAAMLLFISREDSKPLLLAGSICGNFSFFKFVYKVSSNPALGKWWCI